MALTRHHDVAVNRVVRGTEEVVHRWTDRLGVGTELWRGLAEAEDSELLERLDPVAIDGYTLAVIDATATWLERADLSQLDHRPDSAAALQSLGAPKEHFAWLYALWHGQPSSYFLAWEAVGHSVNHLGELISIRNRMGLSPF